LHRSGKRAHAGDACAVSALKSLHAAARDETRKRSAATVKCDACCTPLPIDTMPIAPIVEIVAEIKAGRMVILVDEEDRENEGDLVFAADHVTPEAINFMARFGRGLVCMPITEDRARQLA